MDRTSSTPLRELLNPHRILGSLWREREVVAQLARHDIEATYRESLLGLIWMILQPLLSLGVYTFIFTVIFQPRAKVGEDGRFEFVLSLFAGMIIYNLFAEVVARSPQLIVTKTSYVKNIVFPLHVLPVSALATSFVSFLCGIGILLTITFFSRGELSPTILWLPVALLPLVLLTLGLAWILSSIGVFLRDVQPTVRVVLQLLFFATPIVYQIEVLPEDVKPYLLLNPLASIVTNARNGLLFDAAPSWPSYFATVAVSLLVFCLGYCWFARTRRGFADVM